MCKNPVLKNTKWWAEQKMFIADVGTMTTTITLEFVSARDVVIREQSVTPSHPAMYMNPDGSVDTLPGWTSEQEEKGTYSFKRGKLTVTDEDGFQKVYDYHADDTFTIDDPIVRETLVFRRCEE